MVFLLKKTKTCTVGQRQRVCTITKKTDSIFYHGKKRTGIMCYHGKKKLQIACTIMKKRQLACAITEKKDR